MNRHHLLKRAAVAGMAICTAVILGSTVVGVRWYERPDELVGRAEGTDASNPLPFPSASPSAPEPRGPRTAVDRRSDVPASLFARKATESDLGPAPSSHSDEAALHARSAVRAIPSPFGAASRTLRSGPETLVDALPASMLDLARRTSWNDHACASLDRLVLLTFDVDGDLELDDLERITAVKAMRDAIWPDSLSDAPAASAQVLADRPGAASADARLTSEDLKRHHDVDETRRLDHALRREQGRDAAASDPVAMDPERLVQAVHEFRIVDDGHLTAGEFSRFMSRHRAGSVQADLNDDGLCDEADLRLFLDITSPLGDE